MDKETDKEITFSKYLKETGQIEVSRMAINEEIKRDDNC